MVQYTTSTGLSLDENPPQFVICDWRHTITEEYVKQKVILQHVNTHWAGSVWKGASPFYEFWWLGRFGTDLKGEFHVPWKKH